MRLVVKMESLKTESEHIDDSLKYLEGEIREALQKFKSECIAI